MGEVYRATDTKLGREVALKLLPLDLAGDPEGPLVIGARRKILDVSAYDQGEFREFDVAATGSRTPRVAVCLGQDAADRQRA